MEFAVPIILFLTLFTMLFAFGAAALAPSSVIGVRLRSLLSGESEAPQKPDMRDRLAEALGPISRALPKSPSEVSQTRGLLMQAGYREQRHMTLYFALRVLLGVGALALVVTFGLAKRSPILLVALPVLGYTLPRFVLKRRVRRRQQVIRLALPDALDLVVICVEAGLGLDQSLKRVGEDLRHAHPELSDELDLVHLEVRAGKPRPEALRNLASRTGVDDVRALVAVLVQTDRFGTSVAQALRVHSDSLRTTRRQRAEEQAAKTTIKMVPVLVFFLFPSMFIVSLGPAAISAARTLLPALRQ